MRQFSGSNPPRAPPLESIEKSPCLGAEAIGEPVVDRPEEHQGISGTALIAQQLGKARAGARFPQ